MLKTANQSRKCSRAIDGAWPRCGAIRIRRSAAARRDADEIWLSIAIDSESAAERLMRRFEAAEDRLADFPELGPVHPDMAPGARYWVVGDYLILYRIGVDAVEIVRILHGARDLRTALDET